MALRRTPAPSVDGGVSLGCHLCKDRRTYPVDEILRHWEWCAGLAVEASEAAARAAAQAEEKERAAAAEVEALAAREAEAAKRARRLTRDAMAVKIAQGLEALKNIALEQNREIVERTRAARMATSTSASAPSPASSTTAAKDPTPPTSTSASAPSPASSTTTAMDPTSSPVLPLHDPRLGPA